MVDLVRAWFEELRQDGVGTLFFTAVFWWMVVVGGYLVWFVFEAVRRSFFW